MFTDWSNSSKPAVWPKIAIINDDNTSVDPISLTDNKEILDNQAYIQRLLLTHQPSPYGDAQCTAVVYGPHQQSEGWVKIPCSMEMYAGFVCFTKDTENEEDNKNDASTDRNSYLKLTNESNTISRVLVASASECPQGWVELKYSCVSLLALKTHFILPSELFMMCARGGGRPFILNTAPSMAQVELTIQNIHDCVMLGDLMACEVAEAHMYENTFVRSLESLIEDMTIHNLSYALEMVKIDGIMILNIPTNSPPGVLYTFLNNFVNHFAKTNYQFRIQMKLDALYARSIVHCFRLTSFSAGHLKCLFKHTCYVITRPTALMRVMKYTAAKKFVVSLNICALRANVFQKLKFVMALYTVEI